MNQLFLGLMIGTLIGTVACLPLAIWPDQIFGAAEDVLASVKNLFT